MENKSAQGFISSVATILTATIYLVFPLFFLTITTDFFTFPKQILIVIGSLALFILWGVKAIVEKKVTLLMNPLNIPVLAFMGVLIFSTIFSLAPTDSVLQSIPVILLGILFFTTVNFIQAKSSFAMVVTSLIIGSALATLLSILAFFNVFVLPFEAVRNTGFNTHGSPVQYIGYLLPLLVLCAASVFSFARKKHLKSVTKDFVHLFQFLGLIVFAVGLGIVVYQIIISPDKPILLPFDHGFQVAFASISQDTARLAQSLLVGSGYGTFASDFTRFISSGFNSYPFWNLTFSFSSSYILELLATAGILGLASFAFIFVNFIRSNASPSNPLFLATATMFALTLLIPFSFSLIFLLFALLSLFVAHRGIENAKGFDNIVLGMVTLKQGLISLNDEHNKKGKTSLVFPAVLLVVAILTSVYVLFFLVGIGGEDRKGYVALIGSDIKFAKSFTPAALQSGSETYTLQGQAIEEYPYRSDYYRLYSQINLALAANLVAAQQGKEATPEVQNNIIGLLQQSINNARQAVTLSSYSSTNWQNLGQIYRNLIGVGENAEQFAVASYNQAISLNPSNPGLRIELGGIHFQLQQWDLAQNQFMIATQLKPDYANAYYNLGHALEEKGDLQSALNQYLAVKQLVANDPPNMEKIDAEIVVVQKKMGEGTKAAAVDLDPTADPTPLNVNQPQNDFPDRDPREQIPEPPAAVVTPSTSPTPTQ